VCCVGVIGRTLDLWGHRFWLQAILLHVTTLCTCLHNHTSKQYNLVLAERMTMFFSWADNPAGHHYFCSYQLEKLKIFIDNLKDHIILLKMTTFHVTILLESNKMVWLWKCSVTVILPVIYHIVFPRVNLIASQKEIITSPMSSRFWHTFTLFPGGSTRCIAVGNAEVASAKVRNKLALSVVFRSHWLHALCIKRTKVCYFQI